MPAFGETLSRIRRHELWKKLPNWGTTCRSLSLARGSKSTSPSLWDAFETNYTHGKYQFAFLAYHMLTMSFVYFKIWQIKKMEPKYFEMSLIGFGKDVEKNLSKATSPFAFSIVNERSILRIFKLIACDNSKIGTYAKLVDDRNKTAHPNGKYILQHSGRFGHQDHRDSAHC